MPDLIETREGINPGPKIIDLMEADDKSQALFSEQVSEANGQLLLLVHPFYQESELAPFPEVNEYRQKRKAAIDAQLDNRKPLILFEEEEQLGGLRSRIDKKGTIFTVTTLPDRSTPKTGSLNSWDEVAERLRSSGVKQIELGGAYLDFSEDVGPVWISDQESASHWEAIRRLREKIEQTGSSNKHPWLDEGKVPSGCVGTTGIEFLMQGFDVEFSPVALPRFISTPS